MSGANALCLAVLLMDQETLAPTLGQLAVRHSESATGVPLIPAHVLRQMGDDDRLLITGNKPPAQIEAILRLPRRWQANDTSL